jgi:hypothetical protein
MIMILDKIPDLLETFSKQHGYDYDPSPLPFIPFGGIRGVFQDCRINMYIYRSESNVEISHNTLFAVPERQLFPEGFCIEYAGAPHRKDKPFYQQISVLSYDKKIVTDFLNMNMESQLISTFDEIDDIDTSIFHVRSNLRLSEDGFSLSVCKIFVDIAGLNKAFSRVMGLLTDLKYKLASNM